jgi:integrase
MVPLPVAFAIADALPARYRMLVILTAFTGLRWGELVALRRDCIDLDACEIRVTQTTVELDKGGLRPDTPKSHAGRRTVAFPAELVPDLADHIDRYAERGPHGLVFVGPKGAPLRRTNFRPLWLKGVRRRRRHRLPLSRPPAHGRHSRRWHGRDPQGADGPARPLQPARRHDLPARHPRPRSGHRQGAGPVHPAATRTPRQMTRVWPVCGPLPGSGYSPPHSQCHLPGPEPWSGRRESNPHDQLGRLGLCH